MILNNKQYGNNNMINKIKGIINRIDYAFRLVGKTAVQMLVGGGALMAILNFMSENNATCSDTAMSSLEHLLSGIVVLVASYCIGFFLTLGLVKKNGQLKLEAGVYDYGVNSMTVYVDSMTSAHR